jgi:hypothetical protein
LLDDCPAGMEEEEFTRLLAPLVIDLPTQDEGLTALRKLVQDHIDRLEERMELMGYREQRALNAALGAAQSPCDRESVTRDRYITQSDRAFNTAVRVLLALKQERRKHGDESLDDPNDDAEPTAADLGHQGPDAASGPEEMDVPADVIPAVNEQTPNEPDATQVIVPEAGNNADRPAPADANGPVPLISPEVHAANMERRKKTMEYVQRKLNERSGVGPSGLSEMP